MVGLGTPTHVGSCGGTGRVLAVVAHTVDFLNVVPLGKLGVDGKRTIVLDTKALLVVGALGRDEDHTMGSAATVQCRSGRALEHGHALDVIGIDGRDAVTQVIATLNTGTTEVGVIQGHTVNNIQRLVITGHLGVTTQQHAGRTRSTASGLVNNKTGNLTGQ